MTLLEQQQGWRVHQGTASRALGPHTYLLLPEASDSCTSHASEKSESNHLSLENQLHVISCR